MADHPEAVRNKADYDEYADKSKRLLLALREQLSILVSDHEISLAVPIETRVKTWHSVEEKLEAKGRRSDGVQSLTDLAGMRFITLFQEDVEKLDEIIQERFVIRESEDTAKRLDHAQFGYRSNHYIVTIPPDWESIPSFSKLGGIPVEIQVRTLPQHMWAAASHKLQYKREDSAPPRLRRAINRVAAILEMVDLEFSRILEERSDYYSVEVTLETHENLNVDNIAKILDEIFPPEYKDQDAERYDHFLEQMERVGVTTLEDLTDILHNGRDAAINIDKDRVSSELSDPEYHYGDEDEEEGESSRERLKRGVFYTHLGLAREAYRHARGPLPGDAGYPRDPKPDN